jgi:tetratricopeptide (TPR) repeat protein
MAVVHYFRNDPVPMIIRLIDAIEHAERAGPSVELAGAYAETGAVFGIAGFDGAGKRYLRQAIEIAQRIGHPPTLAYVHMVNCLYSVGVGRWQAVRSSAAECQSICDRLGDHVNWGNAQIVRFWLHHYLGEPRESVEAAQNLLARARKIGNQQQEVWALCGAGLAGLRLDRSAEALRYLEDAARLHEHSDQNNLILTLGCEALARMRLGDVERAQEVAKAALEMLMRVRRPTGHATLEGCSAIAEVVLSAPRVRFDLAKLAVEGLRRYRKAFPIGEPRYRYWRGVLRSRANRQRGAMRSWMLGIRAARDLSMTYDVALIEERIGAWH